MTTEIKITIDLLSDFHIGTGSGRGRSTDATILRDSNGVPYLPGSTIKGLVSYQARRLREIYPCFNPDDENRVYHEVFGGGTANRWPENRVCFNDAYPVRSAVPLMWQRTGRSAQDRDTGRARRQGTLLF